MDLVKGRKTYEKLSLSVNKQSAAETAHLCARECSQLEYTIVHNSDHLPYYPLDNHNCSQSDFVCWSGSGSLLRVVRYTVNCKQERTR